VVDLIGIDPIQIAIDDDAQRGGSRLQVINFGLLGLPG
jgi:hypothetical protein